MKSSIRRAYLMKKNKEYSIENEINKTSFIQEEKNNKIEIINTKNKNKDKDKNKDMYEEKIRTIINNNNTSKIEEKEIKMHENSLRQIEMLQKELNDMYEENKLISKEINEIKREEREQQRNYNKIINDINKQSNELNKLKDINNRKNREFLQLRNQHREMMIRDIRQIHAATVNEINRHSLQRFFQRLIFLSRMRNMNSGSPPMTNEQIQSLPISYYPRNNQSNEKCIICSFPFCYNDVIIRLRRCNHIFHKACLTNTLTISRSSLCPTCKTSII